MFTILSTVGQDCYTRLWSLKDGHLLRTIPSPHPAANDLIPSVVFSSNLGGSRGLPGLLMAVKHDLYYFPYNTDYQEWGVLRPAVSLCIWVWLGKDVMWQPFTLNLDWSGDLKELLLNFMGVASSYTWSCFCAKRKWKCCIHMCTPVQFGFPYCSFYRRSALILNTANLDCYWK